MDFEKELVKFWDYLTGSWWKTAGDFVKAVTVGLVTVFFVALTIASTAELSERQGLAKLLAERREQELLLQTARTNSPLKEILQAERELKALVYLGSDDKQVKAIRAGVPPSEERKNEERGKGNGKSWVNRFFL
jgi:hypothetical protein